MNDEIKEILDYLKITDGQSLFGDEETFTAKECQLLLDYITNLQSNWNSLREDIKHKKDVLDKDQTFRFNHETEFKLSILNYVLDKMNELESGDNNDSKRDV